MDNDDFNSSDLDFGDAPAPNFSRAGEASIAEIIAHASEDRISSKKASKHLTNRKVSPKTGYKNILWHQRFEAVREHSLKTTGTPKGEDIVRFLAIIVDRIKPIRDGAVPSVDTIDSGLLQLEDALVFHYADFHVSPHERKRIRAMVNELVYQGKLTRDPVRQKLWVGAVLVEKMATSVFKDALTNGTINWDVTIYKALVVVTVAALATRAGDITKDHMDEHFLPYLAYGDISLKLVGGNDISNLQGNFVIRNEKKNKHDPKLTRPVRLTCLQERNTVCPIKLLLIHALRHGYVHGKSIDEVLSSAGKRADKQIMWTNNQAPVFCAIASSGSWLELPRPASNEQPRTIIQMAGLLAGILGSIVAHDFKRGAARDLAHLPPITGIATPSVAAALGHSNSTLFSGVTADYVGGIDADLWTERLDRGYEDPFGLQIAKPFRKRKLTKEEITNKCRIDGVDPSDAAKRRHMGKKIQEDDVAMWMNKEKNRTVDDDGTYSSNSIGKTQSPLVERSLSQINQNNLSLTLKRTEPVGEYENEGNVDLAELQQESQRLGCLLTSYTDSRPSAKQTEAITDYLYVDDPPTELETMTALEFVSRFSSINLTTNQVMRFPTERAVGNLHMFPQYAGNSRDVPTAFLFYCSTPGCTYANGSRDSVRGHEASCSVAKIEAADLRRRTKKAFRCQHPDSAFRANTKNAVILENHLREKGAKNLKELGRPPAVDPTDPDEFDRLEEEESPPHYSSTTPSRHGTQTRQHGNKYSTRAQPDLERGEYRREDDALPRLPDEARVHDNSRRTKSTLQKNRR